jgi:diadenosine tetraphosphate (Ap4A) HIT family hydrolase
MKTLPIPPREAIVYENDWLYVCLASYPMTKGHTVVVWKQHATDIHNLNDAEYDYLMEIVDVARDALLATYHVHGRGEASTLASRATLQRKGIQRVLA